MENSIAAPAVGAGAENVRIHRGAVIAAAIGNSFEWYDFTVYALFSLYLAEAFFPGGGTTTELVKSLLAFGLGFVARPVGALALGLYGDRVGRKAVLTLALSIMFLGTAILAFAPTYAAIGVGAPLMILAGRTLQGFSAGGEFGGAATFLSEHGPAAKRGQTAAWLQASMGLSNIMGAVVAYATATLFTHTQMVHFAWRIPFLFGLLIALAGLWMRRTMRDGVEFSNAKEIGRRGRLLDGFTALFGRRWRMLAKGVGLSILLTVASYVLVIFMPVYVQRTFGFTAQQAFTAALVGNILLAGACIASGFLSDRVGRRAVLLGAAAVLGLCGYPLLLLLEFSHTLLTLVFVQSVFCVATGAFAGPAPAALSETFPAESRSISVSVSYNIAVTVFSGFAPAALTWIAAHGGGALTPAWYVTFAAVLGALAALAL
jgi:MHS family proline/betaine transporter-like MFS transporter